MSFNERRTGVNRHPWTLPQLSETEELTRPITHASSGNLARSSAQTMRRAELASRKSNCVEEAFSVRGDWYPLRERIRSDSMVLVELKTNVIVGDEFVFITELSAKLAERYSRPVSSIAVNVQHSQCLFFAGTFEPAYTATVSALAEYVQPITNRRNACVLSEHLEEALGVPPSRGLFTFVPLPEENVTLNGKTVAQAVDEAMESEGYGMRAMDEEKPTGVVPRKKRLSVKSLSNIRTSAAVGGEITPPTSADDVPVFDTKPPKVARRRKSFVTGLFGRSYLRKENEKPVVGGQ